ncbi:MAG: hypothetical protein K9K79_04310, partial [Desulfohalobiaceae bacterium]|nr:hypothetical protein [Desulfohalobiaceae bacterium]
NIKSQITNKFQYSNSKKGKKQEQSEPNVLVAYSVFGICHLRFICDLKLGIWNFMFYSIWVAGEARFNHTNLFPSDT